MGQDIFPCNRTVLARKNADGPDLDIDISLEALLETMKKSIETGEDLVIQVTKPHAATFEEEYLKDEKDIRELVERVRKHPIRIKPKITDCWDWDVYVLFVKSYNRHNYERRSIKLKDDFHDKRFAKNLGHDY